MAKDISRTLIVGLGGTGQTVICDIKKRLLRTYGEIPSLVKFLEFDTDELKVDGTPFTYYYNGQTYRDFKYRIDNNEFLQIPSPGRDVVREDVTCTEKLNIPEFEKVSARLQNRGAGGYRVFGRAHFLNASNDIIRILSNTIRALTNANLGTNEIARGYNVSNNGITVYVIASLAGGTGSSAFMDISRMLQIAGINVQYNVNNANMDKIFGVFFLPKFFEGKPHTDNVKINAYTALSELDYVFDLADPTRHQQGSTEVQEDRQNYTGHVGDNRRVIYDGIYLIDSLTSNGHTHTISEASNYVASFIAGSIAADSAALTSAYVNSNHKMTTVKGKYQNYSGLGYCELRFDRQELVRYLLNKKLLEVIERFKSGENVATASQIALNFINTNLLNEGVIEDAEGNDTRTQLNELTDVIIDMSDRGLTSLTMASVDTGREAATNIVTNKTRYLTNIGTRAQEMIQIFARRKKGELLQALTDLLDKYKTSKGFSIFPDLALCLKSIISEMKRGLEDEIVHQVELFNNIENRELPSINTTIAENSSRGFLGIGNKQEEQEAAIRKYSKKVRFDTGSVQSPTLAWLKVDNARKNEAVAVYEAMIGIIDDYYKEETEETINGSFTKVTGSYRDVDTLYKSLMDLLIRENNSYNPSRAAINETIKADAYFKDYFEQHDSETIVLDDQSKNALDEYIGSLFIDLPIVDGNKLAEMRQTLLNLLPAEGLIRKMEEKRISIDQLFIKCFGTYGDILDKLDLESNPQLKLLSQVDALFETLWSYLNFNGQGRSPVKHMVVGVFDTQDNIFTNNNGYEATINGWQNYSYISLGDPDRIAFMLLETAIPAFKLFDVDQWANDFENHRQAVYSFSDKRLENIEMIKPGAHEDAEIAWAYGWLFGLIINPSNKKGIRVKPTLDYLSRNNLVPERGGWYNYFQTVKHNRDLFYCHQKFINDPEMSKDIYDQVMELLDRDPIGNIKKIKKWVNDREMWSSAVRGKEESSMSERERKVIFDEIKYLSKRFVRLGYGLTLDNDRVTHSESEALQDE